MSQSEDYLDSLLASAMEQNYKDILGKEATSKEEVEKQLDNALRAAQLYDEPVDTDNENISVADSFSDVLKQQMPEIDEEMHTSIEESVAFEEAEPEPDMIAGTGELQDVSPFESSVPELDLNMSIADAMMENMTIEEAMNRENGLDGIQDAYVDEKADELVSVLGDEASDADLDMDFSLEDIEARLAAASDISDLDSEALKSDDMDVTELIDSMDVDDPSLLGINEVLKKSDEGVLVDPSIRMEDEDFADEQESESEEPIIDDSQADETETKKGKKKKAKKEKKTKKEKKPKKEKNAEDSGEEKAGLKGIFGLFKKKAKKNTVDAIKMAEDAAEMAGVVGLTTSEAISEATSIPKKSAQEAELEDMLSIIDSEIPVSSEGVDIDNPDTYDAAEHSASDDNLSDGDSVENTVSAADGGENTSVESGDSDNNSSDVQNSEGNQADENGDKKAKKPGLFARLMSLLTEEVEEEDESAKGAKTGENSNLISDENQNILDQIDAEDEGKKKKGKKVKEKKVKEKKEKKPKPKKEKKPKEKDNGKKIPKKYITVSMFLGISIFAALFLITSYVPELMNMAKARESFYNGDYNDAFLTMYGKDLNESDKLIYDKSRTIILMDRKYESYENYKAMGMEYQALNALFSGLEKYHELESLAIELSVIDNLKLTRNNIISALASYGVSEAEAEEVINYSDLDYTLKLEAILAGEPYTLKYDEYQAMFGLGSMVMDAGAFEEEAGSDSMPDLLPEEQEYLNSSDAQDVIQINGDMGNADIETTEESQGDSNESSSNSNVSSATANSDNVTVQIESELFN